jgi:Protein kinase domain
VKQHISVGNHYKMLQSYIDAWVEELERVVSAYEAAVDEVEQAMDRVEQTSVSADPGEQLRHDQYLRELDIALESAQQVAALVKTVNAALDDAIDAAQLVVTNEQVGLPVETCEEYAPVDQLEVPTSGLPASRPLANRAPARDAPTIYGRLDAVGVINPDSSLEPLPDGAILIQGKYRIVRLLHSRPRLNLYLAERTNDQSRNGKGPQLQPLVAIRELVLAGLTSEISKQIDHAAFEEFAAPMLFGSPHLPGAGDRMSVENERHYTVMQLRQVRGKQHAIALSLAELLLHQPRWPAWLDIDTAWTWGIQLCRIVARLHRMGVTLGDLHPATILVDPQSAAEWAPVLLVSWPPPSRFWSTSTFSSQSVQELSTQVFPIAEVSVDNAFAAPEIFNGGYDERSDVYSLGAILYLLLTRYAPVAALQRMRAEQTKVSNGKQEQRSQGGGGGIELIPPHLFNRHIPLALEQVVVRALSLNPVDRYSSVAALLEALQYA